ncbi:uncharacterized protein C11orf97 homolog isoform X2 [Vidua chalybeata]|uniref:uncharacterized protein C11orf97 homolog isoform X2 n=1 Tax=Vidua chalybeata TaxID=81927 RepID=UPI0023A8A4EF|nr:uncharacterized protein C11orf97 homolog isoform X2 [Vidua chalybeata]
MLSDTEEWLLMTPTAVPHPVPQRRPGPAVPGAGAWPQPASGAASRPRLPGSLATPAATARPNRPAAAAMRAAGRQMPAAAAGEPGSHARGEQPRQKCVYVEPPRRVKEILEEHFHLQEEECKINHPAAEIMRPERTQITP